MIIDKNVLSIKVTATTQQLCFLIHGRGEPRKTVTFMLGSLVLPENPHAPGRLKASMLETTAIRARSYKTLMTGRVQECNLLSWLLSIWSARYFIW